MAGTIKYNLSINAVNGNANISRTPDFVTSTWQDGKYYAQTETLSSTFEELKKGGDITNVGITFLHNIGSNDINVSFDSGTSSHLVLGAGEFQLFRLNPSIDITTVQAKSLSGSTLEYCIFSI